MKDCVILDACIANAKIGHMVVDHNGNIIPTLFSTREQAEFWCMNRMIDETRKDIFPDEWKKELYDRLNSAR